MDLLFHFFKLDFSLVLVAVDTLFAIFCECAELNPDPIEGNYDSFIAICYSFLIFFRG